MDLAELEALSPAEAVVAEVLSRQVGEDGAIELGMTSGSTDDERFLPVLAESLPDKPFGAADIALLNTRGQVVHPAASLEEPRRQRVAGSGEAVAVLRQILLICSRGRATDVHLEPKNDDFLLRLRIDGGMVDIVRITKAMGVRMSALVKVLCEIDVQHKNIIQEGHFSAIVPPVRRIDYRCSFAPSMFGQKLVVRVLDTSNAPMHVPGLRMPSWMVEDALRAVKSDSGLILVCGPTGSGKTTTLYALLRDADVDTRNVITIEDPVEIELPGVTQIPVNDEQGNTFPALLRSMLRQDPDVMMVGEIRDPETARIAMQAAMTGHLVLSTLHARDTISSIFRLLDLGVEPYLVSSSLQVVVSQRLARELCQFCKKAVPATPQQLQRMGKAGEGVRQLFVPVGCLKCLKTGYGGRRAFFEMLGATEELREAILKSPTPRDLEQALAGTRFMKLTESGFRLVAHGVTAFEEIDRAVGR